VTVIVIPGLGSTISAWTKVKPSFAKVTRTCFYDRPGLGRSPARANHSQVLNASIYAKELKALLAAAHEPGPYVVIGHSYGGLIARAFVHQNMSTVAAVLLAESVDPGDKGIGKYWSEASHRIDMPASQAATGGGPNLGSRPLLVLSASRPDEDHLGGPTYGQPAWMTKQWIAQQRANTRLSTNSMQVIAQSGHVLQQDNPAATFAALRDLVHSASTNTALACAYNWAKVSATCRS
jgi:pimeloyl-ACP methyl ester carboxylesterase